jgi:hypothetical protein
MEHFIGFWLRILRIGHGLFDADDLMALRALAEAMTSAIHFVVRTKPTHVGQQAMAPKSGRGSSFLVSTPEASTD